MGGGSTLVANIFVAHFWHGDAVHLTDVCGVVCVIAGAALFAISSSNSTEDEVEAKDLPHHFTAPWFLTYLSVQGATMLFLLAGIGGSIVNRWRKNWTFRFMAPVMEEIHLLRRRTEKLEQTVRLLSRKLEPAVVAGIELSSQFSSTRSSMKTFEKNPYGERHWSDKYIYAACAGTVGGLSVRRNVHHHCKLSKQLFFFCNSSGTSRWYRGKNIRWWMGSSFETLVLCISSRSDHHTRASNTFSESCHADG